MNAWSSCCVRRAWNSTAPTTATTTRTSTGPCDCRKPAPGLLLDAAAELALDLGASWMVGDADTDVTAAHAAGARAVLVEHPRTAHRRRGGGAPEHTAARPGAAAALIAR